MPITYMAKSTEEMLYLSDQELEIIALVKHFSRPDKLNGMLTVLVSYTANRREQLEDQEQLNHLANVEFHQRLFEMVNKFVEYNIKEEK